MTTPPLPKPFRHMEYALGHSTPALYTADQMRTYAAACVAAERERTKVLAVWAHNALSVLHTLDSQDMEDGGQELRTLRDRGEALVLAVLTAAIRKGTT